MHTVYETDGPDGDVQICTVRVTVGLMVNVVDPGKRVCADPVNGGAILGKGGTGPLRREQRASVEPGQRKG
jgi:hypothetical protein